MLLKQSSLVDILRNDPSAKTWSMKCLHTANFENDFPNRQQENYSEESASIFAYPLGHKLPEFCSNKCIAISKKASNRIYRTAKDLFRNGSSKTTFYAQVFDKGLEKTPKSYKKVPNGLNEHILFNGIVRELSNIDDLELIPDFCKHLPTK